MCGAKAESCKASKVVKATRKMIIGGNWKCNGTVESNRTLITDTLANLNFDDKLVDIVVAPISIHIAPTID